MDLLPGLTLRGKTYWFIKRLGSGRRIRRSLNTQDLAEAVRMATALLSDPITGGDALSVDVARFLAEQKRLEKYSLSSVENRTFILEEFAKFARGIGTAQVSTAVVQKFYDSKRWLDAEKEVERLAASTCQSYVMMLRAFFKWAIRQRIRADNPCASIVMSRVSSRGAVPFCTRAQVRKLIEECPREDLKFVLYCGFHAGLRTMEIIEARESWFDVKARQLHLQKHEGIHFKDREERSIPMTREFAAFIRRYGLHSPYMLRPEVARGKSLYRWDFDRPFREYVAEQGMPWVTPKVMRHTFASLLASNGTSIYKIAVWMGDDVRVVQRNYAKLLPDREIDGVF